MLHVAKHPNLTQEQAVYWSGRALTQIDQNNRAAALQQKQLEDDAKDAVNEMKVDIETGLIPSETVIKSRLARVKGTKKESEFAQYSGSLVEVQQFMRLGPDEREAYLSKRRSEAQNTAQDNAKDVSWKLNLLSKTHENMLDYEKNNSALAYSIKTGQDLTVVPTNAILSGNPEAITALTKNIKSIHIKTVLISITVIGIILSFYLIFNNREENTVLAYSLTSIFFGLIYKIENNDTNKNLNNN